MWTAVMDAHGKKRKENGPLMEKEFFAIIIVL